MHDQDRPIFKPSIVRRKRSGAAAARLGKHYPHYFGRWKPPGCGWTWQKLFTDKSASEAAWRRFQKEHEQRAAAGLDEKAEQIRRHTLLELVELYVRHLKSQRRSQEHLEITGRMLRRLIGDLGWRTYRHVRVADVQRFLDLPSHAGWTVAYRIVWIKKIKAFVNWLRPNGESHPLEDLRRPSQRNAIRRKARRVASPAELRALLSGEDLPPHRRLAYALAGLNGLRRGEATKLTWRDVALDGDPPVLRISPKDSDALREFDCVPIHPLVERMLREARGDAPATARVLPSMPDAKTVRRDLEHADFRYADEQGRLLCYHALRHTYKHNLERAGIPYTPLRQLMRHVARSVTDTYGANDLRDLRGYLERLDPGLAPRSAPDAVAELPEADERIVEQNSAAAGGLDVAREQLRRLVDVMGVEGLVAEVLRLVFAGGRAPTSDGFSEGRAADNAGMPETSIKPATIDAGTLSPYLSHSVVPNVQKLSFAGSETASGDELQKALQVVVEAAICRRLSSADLNGRETASNVKTSRPDTQAD